MSDNQLVPVKPNLPMVPSAVDFPAFETTVNYEKIDPSHYTFTAHFDDGIDLRMDESEQTGGKTEWGDVEFEDGIDESEKICYSVAAASGILTGAFSVLHLTEEQLNSIEEFKENQWKPIIVKIANYIGYKRTDYKGASKYLVTHAVRTIEKNDKTKETLTVLAEHPSIAGLFFSLITQFAEKSISISDSGHITLSRLPKYYAVGDTTAEKIVCAFLYWLFALGVDEAQSKRRILDEMSITPDFLKKLKEFTGFPFFKNLPTDYAEAEEQYSLWLSKTIKGAELYAEDADDERPVNPVYVLMSMALNLAEDSFPVLINECIVRSLYILIHLCNEIRNYKVTSFDQLTEIPAAALLPTDGRVLSRMCLIASASFTAINVTGAILIALKHKKTDDREFAPTLRSELNLAGIGRFFFAVYQDSKYWGKDIKIRFQRSSKDTVHMNTDQDEDETKAFEPLYMNAGQARILFCLESISVQYDIAHTKKPAIAKDKTLWLKTWQETLLSGLSLPPEQAAGYFVADEDALYDSIYRLAQDKSNRRWIYLLTEELALFKPYIALCSPNDKIFRKLKPESDYVQDQFIRRQTVVSLEEMEKIKKTYLSYTGKLSGRTRNAVLGISAAAAVALVSGGLALHFAPGIAIAIAGDAVVGLHGAALVNAGLAFVGGGALAAGGLGMAGGTAIITGGGALLGLVGSGSVSAAAILLQTTSEYWVRQSAKLLTYCDCVLHDVLRDTQSVNKILLQMDIKITQVEEKLAAVEAEKNDLDKELIKKTKEYLKILKKSRDELARIIKED